MLGSSPQQFLGKLQTIRSRADRVVTEGRIWGIGVYFCFETVVTSSAGVNRTIFTKTQSLPRGLAQGLAHSFGQNELPSVFLNVQSFWRRVKRCLKI